MGRSDSLYEIKQKVTMSQKIVAKNSDYGEYAGADLETALKMAKIKTLLTTGFIPKNLKPLVTFYLVFLDQKRKAFFGATATELTKLGFILGDERKHLRATKSESMG